ncbi:hypothetical protein E0Z10_g714 [Xylaria hypoxylon]|uniref:Malonyl-CoA:ACP transacylase (MAT) domain-containing protein n=1 Tax=Xylaria hypoxylon TaxID=37992 RepID=A0A4Z0YVH5_9PEZI|nr:hypothetical protein E0Z10_g714 [Xylaria hypoxylon]
MPPTRRPTKLNSALRLDSSNLKLVTELEEWPRKVHRASINSFGYGDKARSWSIEQYLSDPQGKGRERNSAVSSQTLCTAIQIAIVDLLGRWDAKPTVVIGLSSGEIAAAFTAGLIDQKQAILIAYLRGCAVEQVEQEGSMMAVALNVETAQRIIREAHLDKQVCVACVNSPESVTLSGSTEGIRFLETRMREMKKPCSVIRSNGRAYHSHMMRDVGATYENMLRSVFVENSPKTPQRYPVATMCSTVGSVGTELCSPNGSIDWPGIGAEIWKKLYSLTHSGNGIDCVWRNDSLRLKEVSWMRDHTVGTQVVFLAAAYLSMIIEGLSQVRDEGKLSAGSPSAVFELRNVSVKAALMVSEDDALSGNDIKLHTTLTPRKISTTSALASCAVVFAVDFVTVKCKVGSIPATNVNLDSYADVHARSERTEVSTQRIHCTLGGAGFSALVELSDKPDIEHLDSGSVTQLHKYIVAFLEDQDPDLADDENVGMIGALLDLAGHKNPRMRVLEHAAFPHCRSWHTATIADSSELVVKDKGRGPFDTIIVPGLGDSEKYWKDSDTILSNLASGGIIITHNTPAAQASLDSADFWAIEVDESMLLARRRSHRNYLPQPVYIVRIRALSFGTASKVARCCQSGNHLYHQSPQRLSLRESSVHLPAGAGIRIFGYNRTTRAGCASPHTNGVSTLLWVTGAGMLGDDNKTNPDLTLSAGLSRALMLEQPALRFAVIDVGSEPLHRPNVHETTCRNIMSTLFPVNDGCDDHEYIQLHGIVHVSRFKPDRHVNTLFEHRLRSGYPTNESTLSQAKYHGIIDTNSIDP